MMRKMFMGPAALAVAILVSTVGPASAAPRAGSGGGRGAVVVTSGYRGPYYGNYYRGGYYPYAGFGVGLGLGLAATAPLYPYAYSPYAYPAPYVAAPAVSYYPPVTVGQAQPPLTYAADASSNNAANIRVLLPDPQAIVLFDGNRTSQTGTERSFHTPPLASSATYRFRAVWGPTGQEIVQDRVVPVSPGQNYVVDFTRPLSEGVPPPAGR